MAAVLAGLALSHTIAKAILMGFLTRNKPFFRTPKMASGLALLKAVVNTWQETLALLVLTVAAVGVYLRQASTSLDLQVWIIMLVVQSIPYAAALLTSIISGFPSVSAKWIGLHKMKPEAETP
jgi:hypothetical protein